MKANLITTFLLWCSIVGAANNSFAQSSSGAQAPAAASNAAIGQFNKAIGQQSLLYNGPAYDPGRLIKNNPNYKDTAEANPGSIVYYGFAYKNIPLLYDIYQDVVASVWVDGESKYSFLTDKVSEFNLMGHHFIRLSPDSAGRKVLKGGFYDDVYTNKLQVLVKQVKIVHVTGAFVGPTDFYETHTYYYLKKGGLYYEISGEGDLLSVLKDHENELKKYIKDNKIKFSNEPEQAMVLLAGYYDKLTN